MQNKKSMTLFIFLLLSIVGGSGYYWTVKQNNNSKKEKSLITVTVRLNWLHNAQFAGMYLANKKGYYRDEGLEVIFKEYASVTGQEESQQSDNATIRIMNPLELLLAVANKKDLKAVAAIYQTSPWAFASLKDTSIVSPAQFFQKKLGSLGGASHAVALYSAQEC
ncbi:MAG: ABC transporter substrate-binding protein [Parcubacteria group bacterium]|nr:ABC transporter substrate-binding protein [Parcubacteria group bacterium]